MPGVVKFPELNAIIALRERPGDPSFEFIEGGWVEVPDEVFDWPEEVQDPPSPTLGVCRTDPRHHRLFRLADDLEPAGFEPTGMVFGGRYAPDAWDRLVAMLPDLRRFNAIPDTDPPGAMDQAMRYIREARRPWRGS